MSTNFFKSNAMFAPADNAVALLLIVAILYTVKLLWGNKSTSHPLPPGPRPWPILGNFAHLPPSGVQEWQFWLDHKDKYGPISSVTTFGNTIVLLHSPELAFELLERRAAKHSSRPHMIFSGEMVGWTQMELPSGDRLRAFRRLWHAAMIAQTSVPRLISLIEVESDQCMLRILDRPKDFKNHVRTEVTATILKMTYGYDVEPHQEDPLVDLADQVITQFSAAGVPGAWMVDTIPALRHVPEWFPGAEFKKLGRMWRANLERMGEIPMQFVRRQMDHGSHKPSYVSNGYEKAEGKIDEKTEDILKWSAAVLYVAGGDTSVGVLAIFFLAMILYPEVQQKAKEEIDRVIGNDRLPNFSDRGNLPYLNAVWKESFRWHTLAPMGLPHVSTEDDIIDGYLIPKGAMIIPNVWWFAHDPAVYPDPDVFDPTRFLGPSPAPDPLGYAFGFGRRLCPGKTLAEAIVWLTIAKALAVYDIARGRDEDGREIEPEARFSSGVISHPLPYQATISPRSAKHAGLVRQIEVAHPWQEGSWSTWMSDVS